MNRDLRDPSRLPFPIFPYWEECTISHSASVVLQARVPFCPPPRPRQEEGRVCPATNVDAHYEAANHCASHGSEQHGTIVTWSV